MAMAGTCGAKPAVHRVALNRVGAPRVRRAMVSSVRPAGSATDFEGVALAARANATVFASDRIEVEPKAPPRQSFSHHEPRLAEPARQAGCGKQVAGKTEARGAEGTAQEGSAQREAEGGEGRREAGKAGAAIGGSARGLDDAGMLPTQHAT
jgi:hypothetical protein